MPQNDQPQTNSESESSAIIDETPISQMPKSPTAIGETPISKMPPAEDKSESSIQTRTATTTTTTQDIPPSNHGSHNRWFPFITVPKTRHPHQH